MRHLNWKLSDFEKFDRVFRVKIPLLVKTILKRIRRTNERKKFATLWLRLNANFCQTFKLLEILRNKVELNQSAEFRNESSFNTSPGARVSLRRAKCWTTFYFEILKMIGNDLDTTLAKTTLENRNNLEICLKSNVSIGNLNRKPLICQLGDILSKWRSVSDAVITVPLEPAEVTWMVWQPLTLFPEFKPVKLHQRVILR